MQSTRPSDRGGASVLVASKTKWLFGWAQKLKIAVSEQTPLRQYRSEKKQHRPHWANEAVLSPPRPQPPPLVAQSTYALPRGVPEEQRQRRAQFCRKGEGGTSWSSPPWCLCEASFLSGACTKMQPLPQRPLPSASCDQVGAVAQGCGSGLSASPRWGCTWVCTCAWHIHSPPTPRCSPTLFPLS